jgi:hypothetical protein
MTPPGKVVEVRICKGETVMVMFSPCVRDTGGFSESVTVTLKVMLVPGVVGVPIIAEPDSIKPAGKPEVTVQE